MSLPLAEALALAVECAREAGRELAREFHRGPRGGGSKAPIDHEVEAQIRHALQSGFAHWGYRGEETGAEPGSDPDTWWLVDPNDGTSAYLQGHRGSSVSIALLHHGQPVLGVVYSPLYPDDRGDLITWALGCGPVTRNGVALAPRGWASELTSQSVVIVSQAGDARVEANLGCVAPARLRTMPSVAYRLALVAAGEAEAGVSLQHPCSWDLAAAHALLKGAGGELVDQSGRPLGYERDGRACTEYCFGGSLPVIQELARRPWNTLLASKARHLHRFPARLEPGRSQTDPHLLGRAQGCLAGQLAGDSLGALVEFMRAEQIQAQYPAGPTRLVDGGRWNLLAGQPTDDSELALSLARALLSEKLWDPEIVFAAYQSWLRSHPFDVGRTTMWALDGNPPLPDSQANGSLMRISPLGLLRGVGPDQAAEWAGRDSALTHPNEVCQESCRVFVRALQAGLEGASRQEMFQAALGAADLVADSLDAAREAPPTDFSHNMGWVRIALQNAFYQLLHASGPVQGLADTVRRGGDTDTNGAIAGALLGVHFGWREFPQDWQTALLSCRPHASFEASKRPRPAAFWPADCLELAERLTLI